MFPAGSGVVLVCVSGGADSMSLLEALMQISDELGFEIAVAHFNHCLRGAESDRDESFVKDYCADCGVAAYSSRGDVKGHAKNNGLSIEEAARELRYKFFYDLSDEIGACKIAMAHTADDNTETILINLTRGAGAGGLSGIPPVRGNIIRPMLSVTRDEVMQFLEDRGISFVEDSTNAQDIHVRNKIRHHVIPVLKELNPRLHESARNASALLRDDESALNGLADLFIDEHCEGLTADVHALLTAPVSVSSRVIRKLHGGKLTSAQVKSVLNLCAAEKPSAKISLPKVTVYRNYDTISFESNDQHGHGGYLGELASEGFEEVFPADGESIIIFGTGLKISCSYRVFDDEMANFNKSLTSFVFKSIDIYGKITVRPRHEGDKLSIYGRGHTKSLKKLFIEKRIPARKRALVPVIADSSGVLGVYGVGRSGRAVPRPGDMAVFIIFEEA